MLGPPRLSNQRFKPICTSERHVYDFSWGLVVILFITENFKKQGIRGNSV